MANAQGIDISFWQDNKSTPQRFLPRMAIDRGISFAGIKVSQANYLDPDYMINWATCRPMLYRMPYHFLVWDVDPRKQAETFWGALEKDTYGILPLICDFEWWRTTPSNALDILHRFINRMKQLTDLPLGIYTAKYFWDAYGSKDPYWKQFKLWLCDISGPVEVPSPWAVWDFWQYTFKLSGLEYGVESLDLDGNFYNGTLDDMVAAYNLPHLDSLTNLYGDGTTQPVSTDHLFTGEVIAPLGLYVRALPSITAPQVGALAQGDIIRVREIDAHEVWYRVDNGWIAGRWNGWKYVQEAK